MEHIWRMQEFCNSMSKLSPDSYEYAYLKAIVLFSPGVYMNGQFKNDNTLKVVFYQEIILMFHVPLCVFF